MIYILSSSNDVYFHFFFFLLINKNFLVFDHHMFIWLSINKFNNFEYIPESMWTVRSNDMLESDIIKVFKFFLSSFIVFLAPSIIHI